VQIPRDAGPLQETLYIACFLTPSRWELENRRNNRSFWRGVWDIGVNFEWNSRPEGTSDNSPAQNAGFSTRGKGWPPKCFFRLASRRDARFRVPLAIQTTKYRAYLRHAYVFLRSLPRQWNCRATIVRPYGTKIQDLMLTLWGSGERPFFQKGLSPDYFLQ